MALETYQQHIALNTLYKTSSNGSGVEQLRPNISMNSGSVNIYGSQSETQPTSLLEMTLNTENVDVSGISAFGVIPKYIYVTQGSGTTTEIVLSGVQAESLGGF